MEKRIAIPNTDLSLYPIGLGTVDAGLKWDGAKADQIIGTYLEQGGNVKYIHGISFMPCMYFSIKTNS